MNSLELLFGILLLLSTYFYCAAALGNKGYNGMMFRHMTHYGLIPVITLFFQQVNQTTKLQGDHNGNY